MRVAVTSPVAGSYAVIVSVVSSELYSVDAMTMPRRGAVDGSAAADAVPCAAVVEAEELDGVEDAPQAVRRRALVAVAMKDGGNGFDGHVSPRECDRRVANVAG